jgi:hypothetical protein
MKATFIVVAAVFLVGLAQAQTNINVTNVVKTLPIKKGLTMQATVWPSY